MADWRDELGRWLAPFVGRFGHKARRRMCPLYVAGLIGPGDRKSVGPMAERVAPGDYDRLHHFVSDGVWDETPLERELALQADKAGWRRGRLPGHRRHGVVKEGDAFCRGRAAICFDLGQDGELPNLGVADAGAWRGSGDGGPAAVPAGDLDLRRSSARARRRAR